MATQDLAAKLVIETQVKGQGEIEGIASELQALAQNGGEVAPKLQAAAESLRALGQQDKLIADFSALRREAADAADALGQTGLSAEELEAALRGHAQALEQARRALDEAGLSTHGLTDQQAELRASLVQAAQQVDVYADAMHAMRGEADGIGPALRAAFDQLGMRGVKEITAEIEQLQVAMRALRLEKMLPEDAERVSAALQDRIDKLRVEMRGAQTDAKGASDAVDALGKSADGAGNQLANAAHKAAAWTGALIGIGQLKSLAQDVVSAGAAMEQLERRLTGVLGSAQQAADALAMLNGLARETPFNVQGLTDAYAKLAAFGLRPTHEQMLSMTDAVAALGGGSEQLATVTQTLGQAWAKSELQGRAIMQLIASGIPVWDLLAQATGKTTQELQKMSEAGELGRDAITQLIDAMGKKNAGAGSELMKTYSAAVQQVKGAVEEFFDMIAKSGVLDKLKEQLQAALAEFDRMKDSGELKDWAKRISDGMVGVIDAVRGAASALKTLAPAIEAALKIFVAYKIGSFAADLVKTGAAATEMAASFGRATLAATGMSAAMNQAGAQSDRLTAKLAASKASMVAVGMAAFDVAQRWYEIAKTYGAYRDNLAKAAAIEEDVAKRQGQIADKLAAISKATGVTVASIEALNAAQADGSLVFDEASATWLSAAQAQEKLAGAVKLTTAQLAQQDAGKLVDEFEASAKAAGNAEKAVGKLVEALNFKTVQGAGAWVKALDEIQSKGELGAKQVSQAWQDALAKLNAGNLGALRANLEEAARAGIISAQQLAQANEQILQASFDKLGVNAAQALGKISEGAQEAINAIGLVADAARDAGASTEAAARAIEMAFAAAIPKADSLEAIDALGKQLQALGAAGKISAEGIERTQAALEKQRQAIEDQIPGIQSLNEALRQLGVTPQAELDKLAKSAKEAFDYVQSSGTATAREIDQAWKAMAEAAIAANNGVADAMLKAQAEQHGFAIKTDEAGKSIVEAMNKAAEATAGVGAAAKDAGDKMAGMANAAWDASRGLVEQAHEHNDALGDLQGTWFAAGAAASKYAQEVAKLVWDATKNVQELTREHAELVYQLELLEKQQKQLEEQGGSAAKGVDDLRLKLLELNGTQEQIAKAQYERDVAEVKRQQALLQIDLQRAQINGDQQEVERIKQEINLLGEQLDLLAQIYREEEKQRKAKERASGSSSGGSGGSSGSGGSGGGSSTSSSSGGAGAGGGASGGLAAPTTNNNYSITLNATGVNDPAALARMIEPELKKLARLAR